MKSCGNSATHLLHRYCDPGSQSKGTSLEDMLLLQLHIEIPQFFYNSTTLSSSSLSPLPPSPQNGLDLFTRPQTRGWGVGPPFIDYFKCVGGI